MSLMIFRFWTATVLTFFKKWLKVEIIPNNALEIIPNNG